MIMNKLFYIKLLCLVFILLNTNEGNSDTFSNKKTVQPSSTISNSIIHAYTESERWTYYGGDEFNDNHIDTNKWSVYDNNNTYGQPQGMIQFYNARNNRFSGKWSFSNKFGKNERKNSYSF